MSRVLVTGSRNWADRQTMLEVLSSAWKLYPGATLVHGSCKGADLMAEEIWLGFGGEVEPHPADWITHGKAAGPIRNKRMVELGADVCYAFVLEGSIGTSQCLLSARQAGIPTIRITG